MTRQVPEPEPQPQLEPEPQPEPAPQPEPEPEPAPEPAPQPEPEPNETGGSQPIAQNMDIAAGRVTTLDTGLENVASIKITELPEIGNLTVNPDNTLALVLTGTDYSGPLSFQYDATFDDGTSQNFDYTVDVQPLTALKGWSTSFFA